MLSPPHTSATIRINPRLMVCFGLGCQLILDNGLGAVVLREGEKVFYL